MLVRPRAEMRGPLEEAALEQERLQEVIEAMDTAHRATEVTLERTYVLRDKLTAALDVERSRVNQKDLLRAQADAADLEEARLEARACLARAVLAEANAARLANELKEFHAASSQRPAREPAPRSRKGGTDNVRPPVPAAAKERGVVAVDATIAAEDSYPPLPFSSSGGPPVRSA